MAHTPAQTESKKNKNGAPPPTEVLVTPPAFEAAPPALEVALPAPVVIPTGPVEGASADPTAGAPAAGAKSRNPNKIIIVVGEVYEFDTNAKAEKFLNAENAPKGYVVIRGKLINTRKKIALR